VLDARSRWVHSGRGQRLWNGGWIMAAAGAHLGLTLRSVS
jgi:hypothetical protein